MDTRQSAPVGSTTFHPDGLSQSRAQAPPTIVSPSKDGSWKFNSQAERARHNIAQKSDVWGPPLHSVPSLKPRIDEARLSRKISHPTRRPSAANLCPNIVPSVKNSPYASVQLADFYDSVLVSSTSPRTPPNPVIPKHTRDLEAATAELREPLRSLAFPNLPGASQPVRKCYFLERDDFTLRDYTVEFRHKCAPVIRNYNSSLTLDNPSATEGLQHQADIIICYNRMRRTDYTGLAQVLIHSEWSGYEFLPLIQLPMQPCKIRFEYVKRPSGAEYWALPINVQPTIPTSFEVAQYDNNIVPMQLPGVEALESFEREHSTQKEDPTVKALQKMASTRLRKAVAARLNESTATSSDG